MRDPQNDVPATPPTRCASGSTRGRFIRVASSAPTRTASTGSRSRRFRPQACGLQVVLETDTRGRLFGDGPSLYLRFPFELDPGDLRGRREASPCASSRDGSSLPQRHVSRPGSPDAPIGTPRRAGEIRCDAVVFEDVNVSRARGDLRPATRLACTPLTARRTMALFSPPSHGAASGSPGAT